MTHTLVLAARFLLSAWILFYAFWAAVVVVHTYRTRRAFRREFGNGRKW